MQKSKDTNDSWSEEFDKKWPRLYKHQLSGDCQSEVKETIRALITQEREERYFKGYTKGYEAAKRSERSADNLPGFDGEDWNAGK